ncbi:hypothetical protein ACFQ9X_35425 [Catenulispora yoronensis]
MIVATDHDGALSPVEVQNVWSDLLPPMRRTDDGLSVSRYAARFPR